MTINKYRQPSSGTRIWRYVTITKFISLLMTKSLYFSKVSNMDDEWEGASPYLNTIPLFRDNPFAYPPDQIEQKFAELQIPHPSEQIKSLRDQMFINCWHMNDYESLAMWKIYAPGNESVAITSSFSTLRNFLPKWIMTGKVEYINYQKDNLGSNSPYDRFLRKRVSFAYEKEVRAILWSNNPSVNKNYPNITELSGVQIPMRIDKIISEVYVNPLAPSWFAKIVEDIVKKYEFNFPVRQSVLSAPGVF